MVKAKSSLQIRLVEAMAPGIISRKSVCEPLQTGITSIDAMIPIGRGQRELILVIVKLVKLQLDRYINQTEDVVCVYVGIGQKLCTSCERIRRERCNVLYNCCFSKCMILLHYNTLLHIRVPL
jgi:F0F1-type ATP synthase alpha subunit